MATGTTNEEGQYRLETGNASGVVPGEYRVTVSKSRFLGASPSGLPMPSGAKSVKIEYLIPPQYDNPATTPLKSRGKNKVRRVATSNLPQPCRHIS